MDYKELQNRLREKYPNTWIGYRDGKPLIASTDVDTMSLASYTLNNEPEYDGDFMHSRFELAFAVCSHINWIDS